LTEDKSYSNVPPRGASSFHCNSKMDRLGAAAATSSQRVKARLSPALSSPAAASDALNLKFVGMFDSMKSKASTAVAVAGVAAKQGMGAAKDKLESVAAKGAVAKQGMEDKLDAIRILTSISLPTSSEDPALKQLISMGFRHSVAKKALAAEDGNLEAALARLCEEHEARLSAAASSTSGSKATPATSTASTTTTSAGTHATDADDAAGVARRQIVVEATERRLADAKAKTAGTMDDYRRERAANVSRTVPELRAFPQDGERGRSLFAGTGRSGNFRPMITPTNAIVSTAQPQDMQSFEEQLSTAQPQDMQSFEEDAMLQSAIAESLGMACASCSASSFSSSSSSSTGPQIRQEIGGLPLPGTAEWELARSEPAAAQLASLQTVTELFTPAPAVAEAKETVQASLQPAARLTFVHLPSVGAWLLPLPQRLSPQEYGITKTIAEEKQDFRADTEAETNDVDELLMAEPRTQTTVLTSSIEFQIDSPEQSLTKPTIEIAVEDLEEVGVMTGEGEDSGCLFPDSLGSLQKQGAEMPAVSPSRIGLCGGA